MNLSLNVNCFYNLLFFQLIWNSFGTIFLLKMLAVLHLIQHSYRYHILTIFYSTVIVLMIACRKCEYLLYIKVSYISVKYYQLFFQLGLKIHISNILQGNTFQTYHVSDHFLSHTVYIISQHSNSVQLFHTCKNIRDVDTYKSVYQFSCQTLQQQKISREICSFTLKKISDCMYIFIYINHQLFS